MDFRKSKQKRVVAAVIALVLVAAMVLSVIVAAFV